MAGRRNTLNVSLATSRRAQPNCTTARATPSAWTRYDFRTFEELRFVGGVLRGAYGAAYGE